MHVIVPIKRFSQAKSRLSGQFTPEMRIALARALAEAVLWELANMAELSGVVIASSEPEAEELAKRYGFGLVPDDKDAQGLNAILARVINQLAAVGIQDVGVVFSDLPLFDRAEFSRIIRYHKKGAERQLTIVSDRMGDGTNIRLTRPVGLVPECYGTGSASAHRAAAQRVGAEITIFPSRKLWLDIDQPQDISLVLAEAARETNIRSPALALLRSWQEELSIQGGR